MLKVYSPSRKKGVELSSISKKEFFWGNFKNPSRNELKLLSKKTGASMEDLTKFSSKKLDSKVILRKNYDIIVLKYPININGKILSKNFEIIYNKDFVVCLYPADMESLSYFSEHIKDELIGIKEVNFFYFLHRIFRILLKEFLLIFDKLELKLEKVEEKVLQEGKGSREVYFVRKNLLFVRKALVDDRNVFVDLNYGVSKYLLPDKIADINLETAQIMDNEELLRDRLTNILDLHFAFMSNKMNDSMKAFTVVASLLLLPMLISGIYGMNVNLPLQEHPNAFYTIILLMILAVVIALLYFKRKRLA
jgi:magnesium transporter